MARNMLPQQQQHQQGANYQQPKTQQQVVNYQQQPKAQPQAYMANMPMGVGSSNTANGYPARQLNTGHTMPHMYAPANDNVSLLSEVQQQQMTQPPQQQYGYTHQQNYMEAMQMMQQQELINQQYQYAQMSAADNQASHARRTSMGAGWDLPNGMASAEVNNNFVSVPDINSNVENQLLDMDAQLRSFSLNQNSGNPPTKSNYNNIHQNTFSNEDNSNPYSTNSVSQAFRQPIDANSLGINSMHRMRNDNFNFPSSSTHQTMNTTNAAGSV